jgi:hypothetical protein
LNLVADQEACDKCFILSVEKIWMKSTFSRGGYKKCGALLFVVKGQLSNLDIYEISKDKA